VSEWTAADIPDLTGRTAVVTGANSGLGFQTALQLARRGARVVLACRSQPRGQASLQRLHALLPAADATVTALDLADLSSVRRFAAAYRDENESLVLLVNNAGVMALPYAQTADGFEMQLGTNHLGHFALTGLLLPALLAGPESRVVTVSSAAHRMGHIDFADLQSERHYRKWAAYGQSKLANLLFTRELQRRADRAGRSLLSVAAHPGYAATELQGRGPRLQGSRLGVAGAALANRVFAQSDARGALPSLCAATDPDAQGGNYYGPNGLFQGRGLPKRVGTSAAARDDEVASRLWTVSEELTGVQYDFTAAGISSTP